jgi:hypothetical protein
VIPKTPPKLTPNGRRLWRRLIDSIGILDDPRLLMLEVLVRAYDRREQARAALERDGCTFLDRFKQQKPSVWLAVERDATLQLQRSFHLLGLDGLAAQDVADVRTRAAQSIDEIEKILAG